MKNRTTNIRLLLLAVIAIAGMSIFSACGSTQELVSTWPSQNITIDGKINDWAGSLVAYPDDNYSIGFKNDNNNVYVCFTTSSRQLIGRIIASGLNVSFESATDASKNYTLKFPLVSQRSLLEIMTAFGAEGLAKESIGTLYQDLLNRQIQFSIIQKEVENTVPIKNTEGIEVKMNIDKDLLIYELKVPLANTKYSFPVGALPGEIVKVIINSDETASAMKLGQDLEGQTANVGGKGSNSNRGVTGKGSRGGVGANGGDIGGFGGNIQHKDKFEIEVKLKLTTK